MISEIISKDKCTGCELCANVCNHNAIKMVSDDMGFYYPDINEACIECNLCKIKCNERLIKTDNYLEMFSIHLPYI
jgi:Pyruvate/2-oxoacid:ferredoxin oxidoreductase delta subunit